MASSAPGLAGCTLASLASFSGIVVVRIALAGESDGCCLELSVLTTARPFEIVKLTVEP